MDFVLATAYALQIALANVALALALAFWARRREDINDFFVIVVGGIAVRTILTLVAFGLTFAKLQREQQASPAANQHLTFTFALAFILSFAVLLGVEVAIVHISQRKYAANTAATLPTGLERRTGNTDSADNADSTNDDASARN
jgi:hypothetical protein